MLTSLLFFSNLVERATTIATKLSTSACASHKALLGCKSCQTPRFQRHRICSGEIRWVCQGRTSIDSSLRACQRKSHSWTLERLHFREVILFVSTCKCLTLRTIVVSHTKKLVYLSVHHGHRLIHYSLYISMFLFIVTELFLEKVHLKALKKDELWQVDYLYLCSWSAVCSSLL